MKPQPEGEMCKTPTCWMNKFVVGSIVKCTKRLDCGIGKVEGMPVDSSRIQVLYENGTEEFENKCDLHHYELPKGTAVELASGIGAIMNSSINPSAEGFTYEVLSGNEVKTIDEKAIIRLAVTNNAELIQRKQFEDPVKFCLKNQALHFRIAQANDDMLCVYNSRVDLLKHQVVIAHKAIQDYNPRYLLADEVGLGKTMEAGLIMKEMKARKLANRVLIVAPSTLVPQWLQEMKSKFNESFEIYDSNKLKAKRGDNPEENPWSTATNVITSLQFARRKNYREEILEEEWDMVIFDEAHHLRRKLVGSKIQYTDAYRMAEGMRERTNSLLLLTATPLQLHAFEFYSLLELLDPGRFRDWADFEIYRRYIMPELNRMVAMFTKVGGNPPTDELVESFGNFIQSLSWLREHVPTTMPIEPQSLDNWKINIANSDWRNAIFKEIEEFRVVSKYMMRNRKADVFPGGPRRQAKVIQLELTEEERAAYHVVSEYVKRGYNKAMCDNNNALGFVMVIFQKLLTSSKAALVSALRNRQAKLMATATAPGKDMDEEIEEFDQLEDGEQEDLLNKLFTIHSTEDEVAVLDGLCEALESLRDDTKARQLTESIDMIMTEDPQEKVLIFTQFLATQEFLRKELSKKYEVVVFNGKLKREDKELAIRVFKDRAQVMISTESGGEGRNFQFCHIMFNYDLPWNPMKLEQRIGRLDRIGQKKMVLVYNFSYGDTVEQLILDALYKRIGLFEETIGAMEPILGDIEKEIAKLMLKDVKNLHKEIEKYEKSLDQKIEEAKEIQRKLEDFTLDTRMFQRERVETLLNQKPQITSDMLMKFIKEFIVHRGGTFQEESNSIVNITVPRTMVLNKTKSRFVHGTFDLQYARDNDSVDFIAFGHPFVEDCLDAAIGELSKPSATLLKLSDQDTAGFQGILFIYLVELTDLQNTRKLVPILIRRDMGYAQKASEIIFERSISHTKLANQIPQFTETVDFNAYSLTAENIIQNMKQEILNKIIGQNRDKVDKEKARLKRLYDFKGRKIRDQLERDRVFLDELEASKTQIFDIPIESEEWDTSTEEKRQKIVPAVKGRVAKAEEELEGLRGEEEYCINELEKKLNVTASHKQLSAAIILY